MRSSSGRFGWVWTAVLTACGGLSEGSATGSWTRSGQDFSASPDSVGGSGGGSTHDGSALGGGGPSWAGSSSTPVATDPLPPLSSEPEPIEPDSADAGLGAHKLDLLFMIDNSLGTAHSQAIFAQSLGTLLERLTNPACVDAAGNERTAPAPNEPCPDGHSRQFQAFTDLHVGFISSSLGDGGANVACPSVEQLPRFTPDLNDRAHLIGSLPRGQGLGANELGFLEWQVGSGQLSELTTSAQNVLLAVGERGCGWEHSLESWYRFLVDPAPARALTRVACNSTSTGLNCIQPEVDAGGRIALDETLLAQRRAFLRPDSTLAIVMLSDENDCSLQMGNQSWVVFNTGDSRPFFRGSSICEQDANDKCCYSCPLGPPEGCAADPVCTDSNNRLQPEQDGKNLRCFDQKRRFGIDLLYPTQRYVNALTQPELCWNAPDLATTGCDPDDILPNGLFQGSRTRSQILLTGIVGVPWQALAASENAAGTPLLAGELRFKSARELNTPGDDTWAQIVGSAGVRWQVATATQPEIASVPRTPPALPQMVESELPRLGVATGNPINGRDYDTSFTSPLADGPTPDDLQSACIFPLPQPINCSALDPNSDVCDCFDGANDSPLCEKLPGQTEAGTLQYWHKANPGLRQLQVLKDLGESSVVGSACPRTTSDPSASDYGYLPALNAVMERL